MSRVQALEAIELKFLCMVELSQERELNWCLKSDLEDLRSGDRSSHCGSLADAICDDSVALYTNVQRFYSMFLLERGVIASKMRSFGVFALVVVTAHQASRPPALSGSARGSVTRHPAARGSRLNSSLLLLIAYDQHISLLRRKAFCLAVRRSAFSPTGHLST